MKIKQLMVLSSWLVLAVACGKSEQAADQGDAADTTPVAMSTSEIVLPATTSSEAALGHYSAGWADFENSRFVTAHEHFRQAAGEDPSFAMAHLMAALSAPSTETFVSNLEQASARKEEASEGEQLLVTAIENALANDAIGWIDAVHALTEMHPDAPRAWVFLGNAYANVNNSIDAREAYEKAIELDFDHVPGHINLGNNLLTQDPKDFDAAESHFRAAVEIVPNEPNPHDLLGDAHRAQGRLEDAYKDYTMAAELAPDLGSGYQQRGHVNSFLGNYEEARADYTRSAEIEDARGSNTGGFFLVFRAFVSLHEGDHAAAIAELRDLAASAEDRYEEGVEDLKINALSNAALIAIESRDADTAAAVIADAATIMRAQAESVGSDEVRDAQEATIAYLEGLLAACTGDSEGASTKAAEFSNHVASSSNPRKLERMHEILGMASYEQGDYTAAAEHLDKGDHLNNMFTKYYLARAQEEAGNSDEATRLYSELAVWNFNGPGYAMFRKDILQRAGEAS